MILSSGSGRVSCSTLCGVYDRFIYDLSLTICNMSYQVLRMDDHVTSNLRFIREDVGVRDVHGVSYLSRMLSTCTPLRVSSCPALLCSAPLLPFDTTASSHGMRRTRPLLRRSSAWRICSEMMHPMKSCDVRSVQA